MIRRLPDPLLALALAVLTLAAYAPLLGNGFVNYDDDLYITNPEMVRRGISGESVVWAFTTFQGANWFPLTRLSWMLDVELYGLEAWGFHLTSVLLHTASAVLLLYALVRFTGARAPSAFVAAVFAVHPLHVESVAWAAARKDVLSGLFAMLALLAYERAARRGGARRHAWVSVWLGLGLLAKPTLVVLPFLLLLLDRWPLERFGRDGRWEPRALRRAVLEKLPLFALCAAASVVTLLAQRSGGSVRSLASFPIPVRVSNALVSSVDYLTQVSWPSGLAVFYPHPLDTLPLWRVLGAAALLVALSVASLRALGRRPYLAVGWLWYLICLVPVIGLVQVGQAARADRYTYLPLIGLGLALAWGGLDLGRGRPCLRRAVGAVASCVPPALAVATALQTLTWRDGETLFRHALAVTERNHVAHINLGVALSNRGRLEEASEHLRQGVRLAPASATGHGVLGDVLLRRGLEAEAVVHYRRALALEPGSARWQLGLADALRESGQVHRSLVLYRSLLARDPESLRARTGLGLAQLDAGLVDRAVASLRAALRERPRDPRLLAHLGDALERSGDLAGAAELFARALDAEPESALLHARRGTALIALGRTESGLRGLREAVRLDPDGAAYRAALASALAEAGRLDEAVASYREALARRPREPLLLNNLAWLLLSAEGDAAAREALRLAAAAAEASEGDPAVLDTLAEAYARTGRHEEAIRTAERARDRATAEGRSELARALEGKLAAWRAAE